MKSPKGKYKQWKKMNNKREEWRTSRKL